MGSKRRALVGRLVAPVIIFGSPLNSSFGAIILEPPHRFAPEPTLDPPRNAPCTKQSPNAKQSPALPAHPTSHPPTPKKNSPTRAQECLLTTNTNSYSDSPTIAEPSQNSTKKNQDLECDSRSRRDSRSGNAICDLGRNAIRDLEADNAIRDSRCDRSPWKP